VGVDELTQGGPAIGAAIAVGGNGVRVSGIQLGIADPDGLLKKARDAAVHAATDKAEQYAAATGQQLGEVVSIREIGRRPQRYQPQSIFARGAIADAELAKALPIRAGEDDLQVRIEVMWALE
jgi:uncharacterized protein YggE